MTSSTRNALLVIMTSVVIATGCWREGTCAEEPESRFCEGDGGDPRVDAGPSDAGTDGETPTDAGPCGECSGATPLCRESDRMCVACLGDGDCEGTTPRCDTDPGECVGCLGDADCSDAAEPICMDGSCTACTADAQCIARDADLPVCEGGSCVQCTAEMRGACGTFVCDGATNTCSSTRTENSRGLCQDCIADDECMDGQLCVAMTFESTDVGQFCLWRQDASGGPGGDCLSVRPYVESEPITSVDGVSTNVCSLALTTCVALNQFRMESCAVGDPPALATDSECGFPGVDDGLCRVRSAPTNQCTIPCLSDDDCKTGSTCNIAATPQYCNF